MWCPRHDTQWFVVFAQTHQNTCLKSAFLSGCSVLRKYGVARYANVKCTCQNTGQEPEPPDLTTINRRAALFNSNHFKQSVCDIGRAKA